jgi:hypothetical protein
MSKHTAAVISKRRQKLWTSKPGKLVLTREKSKPDKTVLTRVDSKPEENKNLFWN